MSVIRKSQKKNNFLVLDKTCLRQCDLSWGAKGLHAYLMGLPDDCPIKVTKLAEKSTNGRDSVRGLLNELKRAGYITSEWIRQENGEYRGLDYIVHETPQLNSETGSPEPCTPEADFLSPDNSCTERASAYPNNKSTYKDGINNQIKTAAKGHTTATTKTVAAAPSETKKPVSQPLHQEVKAASEADSVISEKLTPYQQSRVLSLATRISDGIGDVNQLVQEIEYCLKSPQQFKACGQDFSHKINAIRVVLERGEWQRPAGMVLEVQLKASAGLKQLTEELTEAKAEAVHFKRLLESAKGKTQEYFKSIVEKAQLKVSRLEDAIRQDAVFLETAAA